MWEKKGVTQKVEGRSFKCQLLAESIDGSWRKAIWSALRSLIHALHALHKCKLTHLLTHADAIQVPEWLRNMMDPKRPKGPHAPEFVYSSMRSMGQGTMASRVNNQAKIFYKSTGIVIPERNFPDQKTQRSWRYGMHYVCMVQVGEVLTRAVRNGDKKMALTSDGSPVI